MLLIVFHNKLKFIVISKFCLNVLIQGMEVDSLMIVGGGSTSILVEGTTVSSTDVDNLPNKESQGKVNGQSVIMAPESEEVYIVVNKNTSVKRKVCMLRYVIIKYKWCNLV